MLTFCPPWHRYYHLISKNCSRVDLPIYEFQSLIRSSGPPNSNEHPQPGNLLLSPQSYGLRCVHHLDQWNELHKLEYNNHDYCAHCFRWEYNYPRGPNAVTRHLFCHVAKVLTLEFVTTRDKGDLIMLNVLSLCGREAQLTYFYWYWLKFHVNWNNDRFSNCTGHRTDKSNRYNVRIDNATMNQPLIEKTREKYMYRKINSCCENGYCFLICWWNLYMFFVFSFKLKSRQLLIWKFKYLQ